MKTTDTPTDNPSSRGPIGPKNTFEKKSAQIINYDPKKKAEQVS